MLEYAVVPQHQVSGLPPVCVGDLIIVKALTYRCDNFLPRFLRHAFDADGRDLVHPQADAPATCIPSDDGMDDGHVLGISVLDMPILRQFSGEGVGVTAGQAIDLMLQIVWHARIHLVRVDELGLAA